MLKWKGTECMRKVSTWSIWKETRKRRLSSIRRNGIKHIRIDISNLQQTGLRNSQNWTRLVQRYGRQGIQRSILALCKEASCNTRKEIEMEYENTSKLNRRIGRSLYSLSASIFCNIFFTVADSVEYTDCDTQTDAVNLSGWMSTHVWWSLLKLFRWQTRLTVQNVLITSIQRKWRFVFFTFLDLRILASVLWRLSFC